MEEKHHDIHNQFAEGSNCQVFNAPVSGCVFAMPGSQVTQQTAPKSSAENETEGQETSADESPKRGGEPTFFIHPSVEADQEWQIHDEIVRLVARQGVQEICRYLACLSEAQKVLLPQNAEKAYNELVRLGMPTGEGFSLKTFMKYYKR